MNKERWDRTRRAILPLALLLATAADHSFASPLLPAESGSKQQQLSRTEISALQGGATQYPYATLTLLYLLRHPPSDQTGALYVESIPASKLTSLLLDSENRDAISTLFGTLQWNPYSWSTVFVQVSWTTRTMTSGGKVFEFQTKLLGDLGGFDHPPTECPTTVLVKADTVRFMDRGAPL